MCSATIWMASRIASFGNAPQPVDRCLIQIFPNITFCQALPALTATTYSNDPAKRKRTCGGNSWDPDHIRGSQVPTWSGRRRIRPAVPMLAHQRVQPIVAIPPFTRIATLQHTGANLIVALPANRVPRVRWISASAQRPRVVLTNSGASCRLSRPFCTCPAIQPCRTTQPKGRGKEASLSQHPFHGGGPIPLAQVRCPTERVRVRPGPILTRCCQYRATAQNPARSKG
jgi:hypothetical protein